MAEAIQVEQDERQYWELGDAFVQVLVAELNDALKSMGVDDAEQRHLLCSRLAFGLGNFLDQEWMEVDGRKFYPLLCFSEKFLDFGAPLKELEPLQMPSKEFEFHGAAVDVAHDFFKSQNEEFKGIRVGVVGEE